MSKITFVNNGTVAQSIQKHMSGRLEIAPGETYELILDPAKDITSQAFLKKFYNQYAEALEVTFDIDDYPLDVEKVEVSFDTDGGSSVASQEVYVGDKATKPADPTKEEATFGGWFADEEKTVEFDFNAPIMEDTTVYAKWTVEGGGKSATAGIDETPSKVTSKTSKKSK
jgi:uncharacterized repeat protein (TIGR02543 family)